MGGVRKYYTDEKECTHCHIVKPLSEFSPKKRKDGKPGYFSHCKTCININCHERNRNEYFKNRYISQREKRLSYARSRRYITGPLLKKWKQENEDRVLEHAHKYYQINRDKIKLYNQTEPSKAKRSLTRYLRRTRMKNIESDITSEWLIGLRLEQLNCQQCGIILIDKPYLSNSRHLDHILPIKFGGKHLKSNVQFLCMKCNLAKNRRSYIQKFFSEVSL